MNLIRRWRVSRLPGLFVFVLAGVLGGALFAFYRYQPAVGQAVMLDSGIGLRLHAVTFGVDHRMSLDRLPRRVLQIIPPEWLQKWPRLWEMRGRSSSVHAWFSEPHAILWFACRTGPNRGGSSQLQWRVLSPDGVDYGGSLQNGIPYSSSTDEMLFPVRIPSYPRRASSFTVQLIDPSATSRTNRGPVGLLGAFVIRNPHLRSAAHWEPEPIPHRREDRGVTCVLEGFRIEAQIPPLVVDAPPPEKGQSGWAKYRIPMVVEMEERGGGMGGSSFRLRDTTRRAVATFTVRETAAPGATWDVRQLLLTDPGRNASYAWALESKPLETGGRRLKCWTIPLWPDDPGWLMQLDVVRVGVVPTHRIVRLPRLPFPLNPEGEVVLQTNLLGHRLRIRAVGGPDARGYPRLLRSYPHYRFEFGPDPSEHRTALSPTLELVEARDDTGRVLHAGELDLELAPDTLHGARDWCLGFRALEFRTQGSPTAVKTIELTLALPEERSFQFIVPSVGVR